MKCLAEKCTTVLSGMPHGGSTTREDTYVKIVDLSREIDAEIDAYVDMRRDIETTIETVDDETLRTLLRYRYLFDRTWEEIAVKMNYTYRHITRMHGNALNKITCPCLSDKTVVSCKM